jgi:hypothetical protein
MIADLKDARPGQNVLVIGHFIREETWLFRE